jgi:hypothetical protein
MVFGYLTAPALIKDYSAILLKFVKTIGAQYY